MADRIFLDTGYLIALLNERDALRSRALGLSSRVQRAQEVVVTEGVLDELGNSLAGSPRNRQAAVELMRAFYETPNVRVVEVSAALFQRGIRRYAERLDKEWSLTDCISFIVMEDNQLMHAATADHHFEQAGLVALLKSDG